jgi:hypothetical protein
MFRINLLVLINQVRIGHHPMNLRSTAIEFSLAPVVHDAALVLYQRVLPIPVGVLGHLSLVYFN